MPPRKLRHAQAGRYALRQQQLLLGNAPPPSLNPVNTVTCLMRAPLTCQLTGTPSHARIREARRDWPDAYTAPAGRGRDPYAGRAGGSPAKIGCAMAYRWRHRWWRSSTSWRGSLA
jgi:hypothetical protein